MRENYNLAHVAVRMVDEPPLISDEPMNSPDAAVRVIGAFLEGMDREYFCVVNLQSDLRPMSMNIVSIGALSCSVVHPREVFKSAILSNAASIILIHNHPSGKLTPSEEDMEITNRLQQAGSLIGIPVADHIITGRSGDYFSFGNHGILPEHGQMMQTAAE